MPAITFPEYARRIADTLNQVVATGEAVRLTLQVDHRSAIRGFIAGSLEFADGSTLHFREFIDTSQAEPKLMYAYHYQQPDGTLVFRYDNTPHFPALPTFPHHKHAGSASNVVAADPPALQAVLIEIQGLMTAPSPIQPS